MGFRIVVVKSRAKLELRLNSLIIRGEKEKRIFISEINTLIIQSTAVSMTAALLNELIERNIKVVFCDEKCNPSGEIVGYRGAHNSSKRIKEQFGWGDEIKKKVWRVIVQRKICEQAKHLDERGFGEQAKMLYEYAEQVAEGDETNREGHAAKVYFNCILGANTRHGGGFVNACLNYGYAVVLSACNREIVASGYLTQIGIWHDNEFNAFNFGCDIMEPLRVLVDRRALLLDEGDAYFKRRMAGILNCTTVCDEKHTTLDLAIRNYTKSVIRALNEGNETLIVFPEQTKIDDEL